MVKPETSAPKLITLADLNKAVNLTKKISSKEKLEHPEFLQLSKTPS
jgi:hypothetical protein